MTKEELISAARFIQFPNSKNGYRNYSLPGSPAITRLPLTDRMYTSWSLNSNHFQTSYHIDTVLPVIAEVLNIPFSRDDFTIEERKSDNGSFDISILKPQKEFTFDLYGLSTDESFLDVNYEFLTSSHLTTNGLTEYHKLYRFPHLCSRIINKSTTCSRTLFISGDSQMIPDIAPLACYFRELWYMDNRTNKSFAELYKDICFTDVLVALNNNAESFYLDLNFK